VRLAKLQAEIEALRKQKEQANAAASSSTFPSSSTYPSSFSPLGGGSGYVSPTPTFSSSSSSSSSFASSSSPSSSAITGPDLLFYEKSEPFYELTNFWECELWIDGAVWPSTEHYFQVRAAGRWRGEAGRAGECVAVGDNAARESSGREGKKSVSRAPWCMRV
jgi:hypothetical protein